MQARLLKVRFGEKRFLATWNIAMGLPVRDENYKAL
jgi:hypothetical protein